MAVTIKAINRKFIYNGKVLSDPDINMTPEEVLNFYSNQYPELTTASFSNVEEDLVKGEQNYIVKKQYDTKG